MQLDANDAFLEILSLLSELQVVISFSLKTGLNNFLKGSAKQFSLLLILSIVS